MTWDDLLRLRDAEIDKYLTQAKVTVQGRLDLGLYLISGEQSAAAKSVPTKIRRLQKLILEELKES